MRRLFARPAGALCTSWMMLLLAACGQVSTNGQGDSATDALPPTIGKQPANQSVPDGQVATFSVVATGTAPLAYQWRRNGVAINGAVSEIYSTPANIDDDGATFSVGVSNPVGAVESDAAKLTVVPGAVAPAVTAQPADQSITAGQTATFSVTASGTDPLSYQWQKNGVAITGATGSSYTTAAESTTDNGALFAVVISNSAGTVMSRSARLGVSASGGGSVAPTITIQPADETVSAGSAATFSVTATGTAPLKYQWQQNGAAISGATNASYTTPLETAADNGALFSVVITNAGGSVTSRNARLTVTTSGGGGVIPSITAQPADQSILAGQTATFSVVATGTTPLTYQWQKNGAAISGATGTSYTTAAETTADSGATFAVVVTNAAGSVTSRAAKLTVTAAGPSAPSITTQPADQSVIAGQAATFTVVAAGTAPLSYQWRKNGTSISGATGASYTTPAETLADSGAAFAAVVSNSLGSATSRNALLTVSAPSAAGPDVLTQKFDRARTGANLSEKTLTPTNVKAATFGKLRFLTTDGKVDGQPLYVGALSVGGIVHNVLIVATENDSVYAFDADSGAQLWRVSVVPAGETVSDSAACQTPTLSYGVSSTPVIDRSAGAHGTIFLVAMTQAGASYHHRLHALDLTTGAELLGGPTLVTATYGALTFDSQQANVNAALLQSNGQIYIAWTSQCDHYFYTGWFMAYSEATLKQTAVLNVGPHSGGSGPAIWMSGGGPAVDSANNIYLITANGGFEQTLDTNGFPNMGDFGNSFMRLTTAGGGITVADYFSPSNTVALSSTDKDLGAGGIIVLPDQTDAGGTTRHLAVGAGKDGNIYLVNRDSMGKFSPTSNNVYQLLPSILGNLGVQPSTGYGGVWATPAYFNGHVYYGAVGDSVKSFSFSSARLSSAPIAATAVKFVYPGASPVVSANGTANAILWAHMNTSPAALYAFDASTLAQLYSSMDAGSRDQFGDGAKFAKVVVTGGKVFVPSDTGVAVFGLLN